MNKITVFVLIGILLTGVFISGCTDNKPASQQPVFFNPPVSPPAKLTIAQVLSDPYGYDTIQLTGAVNETLDVVNYTYMEITDSTGSIWVSGYSNNLENGTQITATGSVLTNFHSSTLNRTFEVILFADEISDGTTTTGNSPHGSDSAPSGDIDVDVPPIEGGTRISEILADPASMAGQEVRINAVVIKNVALINYSMLTLDDGTLDEGAVFKAKMPDTFEVSVGDNVVFTGTVMTDVDLGSGYQYEVLLQVTGVE